MAEITGYVEKIIYRREDNFYTVIELSGGKTDMVAVGCFPVIAEGEYIRARGQLKLHASYGEQFVVESYESIVPTDTQAIEKYLASGAIKGLGAALAARIVKRFGDDTFRIIEDEPERLAEIKGISMRMAGDIAEQIALKQDLRQAMMFLQEYGITQNLGAKIYNRYGRELYKVIKTNPYKLADDISGVGFKIADEIAVKAGIRSDSDFRIKSGIFYTLLQAASNGHTYLPKDRLLMYTEELLGVTLDSIEKHIMDLVLEKKLVVKKKDDTEMVYAAVYYFMELNAARMLCDLDMKCEINDTVLENQIERIESTEEIELDELQREAVSQSARNGVLVITGGPGTGKTTTIKSIINFFEMNGLTIELAAPTGRAAKRMKEATGREARTIHRMLELTGKQDESSSDAYFSRNELNPLDADVIIIDEMSMVDINLFNSLLKAITVGTRLIMVGDVNQLPSVGPGNVLRDIIGSEAFHVVKLTKIFRQATMSDIIVNAHKINNGEHIDLKPGSRDFVFVKRDEPNAIINALLSLVRDKLPPYVNADKMDIQVMTLMRKGVLGVERLNQILQSFLNPQDGAKKEYEFNGFTIREGDKVMQIKNNYQTEWEIRSKYGIPIETGLGVFNGDVGIVRSMNLFSEEIEVEFDEGRIVTYSFKQVDELELAYAITVHKAQGSEYPAVVLPLFSGPKMLMTRNLLYTGITRAKSCVCIVGVPDAVWQMTDNEFEQKRYSGLKDRITEINSIENNTGF
ncbi:MAG: ATP-dependent RecD-like DNA helicase [Lachnospiraceae bacterium]|nr:ATP-dependent RecD-like DNA helicase [Lachnospiraceae bacterium]